MTSGSKIWVRPNDFPFIHFNIQLRTFEKEKRSKARKIIWASGKWDPPSDACRLRTSSAYNKPDEQDAIVAVEYYTRTPLRLLLSRLLIS